LRDFGVAPHGGAWIEISTYHAVTLNLQVAPHGGAWIEISMVPGMSGFACVAPHGGAWIETVNPLGDTKIYKSLPTGERGLKQAE